MEAMTVTLAAELVAREYRVRACIPCSPEFDGLAGRYVAAGAGVLRLEASWDNGRRAQAAGMWRLARELLVRRPAVLHLHNGSEYSGGAVALMAWLRGVPVVLTEHSVVERAMRRKQPVERSLLHGVARSFVSVSRFNACRSIHRATRGERQAVVLNGVQSLDREREQMRRETRQSLGFDADDVVIGVAARFRPEKRVAAVVEAAAELLRAGEARLLIVGDGPARACIEKGIDDVGLRERVTLTGFQEDALPFLSAMDIFVHAQAEGTMSISVLEAMQLGCATVIGYGEDEEPVVHRVTGIRVPGAPVPELRAALTELVRDSELRNRLAEAGERHVKENFSGARMASCYIALYRAAVWKEPVPQALRP